LGLAETTVSAADVGGLLAPPRHTICYQAEAKASDCTAAHARRIAKANGGST